MTASTNFFVTKLPREITDADLMSVFAEYSPVSSKVMLDAATGQSKGFGFVLFTSAESGYAAMAALNNTVAAAHNHTRCSHPSTMAAFPVPRMAHRAIYGRR